VAAVLTFRDLTVWQRAFSVCNRIYKFTAQFPTEERYGLSAEMRKTARSVVYNIAEGHRRRSTVEYLRFLDIARGSAAELSSANAPGRNPDP
jgi:four helix bundle protein